MLDWVKSVSTGVRVCAWVGIFTSPTAYNPQYLKS